MNYTAFVGIDVSKKTIDAYLVNAQDEKGTHHQFDNTSKGFTQLFRWIVKNKHALSQTFFCMEHTGIYALPLACELDAKALIYCMEMPLHIKNSMGIRRGKSDKADSKVIALYALSNYRKLRTNNLPAKELLKIKNLLAFRERLMKASQSLKQSCGELEKFSDKELQLMIPSESRKVIIYLEKKIDKVDTLIEKVIRSVAELEKNYDLLQSISGIGMRIAANLLVTTHNFTRFENWRQYSSYAGTAPFEFTSGTSIKRKNKVSPLANKEMKRLLTLGAWTSMRGDRELRQFFERKVAEGKPKLSALNAVKNKLISRIFAVVKRGTPFVKLPMMG